MSKTYSYQEAYDASVSYFSGDELAAKVFCDKYALRNKENALLEKTPDDMHWRIANELARIEYSKYKKPLSSHEIFQYLRDFKRIVPQGSPMYGIGNKEQFVTLSNCYVIEPPADSYGGIHRTDETISQISKRRGGTGTDLSLLRPSGSPTKNSSRSSSGIVSFMERFSNSIREVGQDGRRGALMLTLSVHHPQILDFAKVKQDLTKVTGANISVRFSDEFMNKAVNEKTNYEQRWPVEEKKPVISREVSANEVWMEIVKNAHAMAEPGVLFWDTIIRNSPADCYSKFGFKTVSTNPSLRGETLVLTKDGVFPISYLENKNIEVINYRGEWHSAICKKTGIDKQLTKITFTNGHSIYCTPEHKWPILNTLNRLINNHTKKIIKKETKDLKRQDKIYFPNFEKPIDVKECNFNCEDGFILGWNLGDGWISYHKTNKSWQYGFIFSEEDIDSGIGERVLSYTNSLAKIKSRLRQDHDSRAWTYVTTDSNVINKFSELKADNKKNGIPKSIWGGNHQFIMSFIDGLFSSDGYIRKTNKLSTCQVVLTSAHKKLVGDVQKLLNFYGIKSYIKHSKNNNYNRYDLFISGIFVHKFAKIIKLSNINKQKKLDEIMLLDVDSYNNNRDYLVIKSIEQTQIYEDVYDISVDDDTHTFLMESGITGNCSELPLSANDSCRLLLLVLFTYVRHPFTKKAYFDFDAFFKDAKMAQRLMDDIVDLELESIDRIINKIESDPESAELKHIEKGIWEKIRIQCASGRRTGTGITALGDTIAALGLKYDSDEAIEVSEKIYQTLKFACYESSIDMAEEIGPFPIHSAELDKDCEFFKRFETETLEVGTLKISGKALMDRMHRVGRRNIALLTTPPAGTVSIETQTSSGIEPVFLLFMFRKKKGQPGDEHFRVDYVDANGDSWMEFKVYHPKLKLWMDITGETDETKSPYFGSCANDLDWKKRVELQARVGKHVDHAISSTINLPNDVSVEKVAEIYETAWRLGCKGITVYRDGCRTGVLTKESVKKEKEPDGRPKSLPCDIHHITVQGKQYFVLVGLDKNGKPYEVFAGRNGVLDKNLKRAIIVRKRKGFYQLASEDDHKDILLAPVTATCDEYEEVITRLTSLSLRTGADIHLVVQQLEKVDGPLNSFARSLSRTLKKYIKEDTIEHGEKCPSCQSQLVRKDGCPSCVSCGYSRCS